MCLTVYTHVCLRIFSYAVVEYTPRLHGFKNHIFFLLAHYEEDTLEIRGKKPEESRHPSFHHNARSRNFLWSLVASDGDQKDDSCTRPPWEKRDWLLWGSFLWLFFPSVFNRISDCLSPAVINQELLFPTLDSIMTSQELYKPRSEANKEFFISPSFNQAPFSVTL